MHYHSPALKGPTPNVVERYQLVPIAGPQQPKCCKTAGSCFDESAKITVYTLLMWLVSNIPGNGRVIAGATDDLMRTTVTLSLKCSATAY